MASDEHLRNPATKFNRTYSSEELALFARYVEQRSACQPAQCTRLGRCWVLDGPPSLGGPKTNTLKSCIGCHGTPTDFRGGRAGRPAGSRYVHP